MHPDPLAPVPAAAILAALSQGVSAAGQAVRVAATRAIHVGGGPGGDGGMVLAGLSPCSIVLPLQLKVWVL